MTHALAGGAAQVGEGQVVEVLLSNQDPAASVIDVEERLQIAEDVGSADLVDGSVGKADPVPARQLEHQLWFERALDMEVQLRFGQRSGEAAEIAHHFPHHTVGPSELRRTLSAPCGARTVRPRTRQAFGSAADAGGGLQKPARAAAPASY